jgi:hypothetical protein
MVCVCVCVCVRARVCARVCESSAGCYLFVLCVELTAPRDAKQKLAEFFLFCLFFSKLNLFVCVVLYARRCTSLDFFFF